LVGEQAEFGGPNRCVDVVRDPELGNDALYVGLDRLSKFRSTKHPELKFRALLTEGTQQARFERAVMG
jgi:hypothetical protein